MAGEVAYDLNYAAGNLSQFSQLEAATSSGTSNPGYDWIAETTIKRLAHPTGRHRCRGTDVWAGNNTIRSLAALYYNNASVLDPAPATTGMHYFYTFSVYLPATNSGGGTNVAKHTLLWELHHPGSLYNLAGLGVAPYAIQVGDTGGTTDDGKGTFRISTGNGTVGVGYAYWEPNILIPGLNPWPYGRWVDLIVEIVFAETSTGTVRVWVDTAGTGSFVQGSPAIERLNIPTLPYCNSQNVHNVLLYNEQGLYTGGPSLGPNSDPFDVILEGCYRRLTFADAVAALSGSAGGGDTTAPSLTDLRVTDATLALSYDENLDGASTPAASAFAVTANGSPVSVSNVTVSGATVTLTLASAVVNTADVEVTYTPPASGKIRDAALNNSAGFSQRAINQTSPTSAFGKTTPGSSWLGNLNGYKRASKFTLTQAANVNAIGHYTKGYSGIHTDDAHIRLVLYAADGANGTPGTLLGQTNEYTMFGDDPEAWREVALGSPVSLSPGDYYIGEHYSGPDNAYATKSANSAQAENLRLDGYADGPSTPWSASEGAGATGVYDWQLSIYAKVSAFSTPINRSYAPGKRVYAAGKRVYAAGGRK